MNVSEQKSLTPVQRDLYKEYWLYCVCLLLAVFVATGFLSIKEPRFVLAMAAAIIGFILALAGGTRLMLPLYYGTTFGTILTLPQLPGFLSINRIIAILLLVAVVFEFPRKQLRLYVTFPLAVFLLFQLYYLPLAVALRPPEGNIPYESVFYLFVTLVIACRYWEEKWLKALTWGFAIGSFFLIVVPGLLELGLGRNITLQGIKGPLGRLDGISINAIFFAYTALWTLPLVAVLLVESRNVIVAAGLASLALGLTFLSLMTYNRQTPIILFFVVATFLYFLRSRWRTTLITILVLGAVLSLPVAGPAIYERFSRARSVRADPSLSIRHDKLLIAREMFAKNPWVGVGHNYYPNYWNQYRPKGGMVILQYASMRNHHVDFGYVQILTEYGLIGSGIVLILFIGTGWVIVHFYRITRLFPRSWHSNFMAALAAIFAQLILSLFIQDTFVTPRTYMFYGLLGAACLSIRIEQQKLSQDEVPATR